MTRVKICCIGSVEEARLAVDLGAAALGLVSAMPSGPGILSENQIHDIARTVPPSVATFLLTSKKDPAEIVAQQRRCRTNTIQLCDRVVPGGLESLREALPGIALVQVVHVTGKGSVEEAMSYGRRVDALLLDSGNPSGVVKELGGTGRVHDWSLSAEIVARFPGPVFLAGGLNSANVASAIRAVQPFAVDLCTGVRTEGALDPVKARAFMAAVAGAR